MEPPTPHAEPSSQEMATEIEITAPEDKAEAMCSLQMLAIRVGAKSPTNLDKAGALMDLYAPAALTILPLGASRVNLGLHVQLPAGTKIVLQTRSNFQRRGLTVANPEL